MVSILRELIEPRLVRSDDLHTDTVSLLLLEVRKGELSMEELIDNMIEMMFSAYNG